ncbi:hypothetical protein ABZ357_40800 [Streptomyces sp. NPDC005917]|uniref:hypothetical protein n=1 Tax=unclassified Streptomyces TaxID=2593676 RepID=UPI003409F429
MAAAAAGIIGASLATAPNAAAYVGPTPDCTDGFVCLYYHSSAFVNNHIPPNYGAVFKTASNIANYDGWIFSAGNNGSDGAGQSVKNNAAFVDNEWSLRAYRVYYNSNYNCSVACQDIAARGVADLNSTMHNNNASGKFL